VWPVHHEGVGDRVECVGFPRLLHWSCVNNRGRRLHEFFLSAEVFLLFFKIFVHAFVVIFE